MEGTRNLWSPWYLMPEDKLGKMECKLCNNVIDTARIECFSIWAINMAMDELEL